MASLGDSRRKSGQANIDARRASGRAMRDDMRALSESDADKKTLPALPVRGTTPSIRGLSSWTATPSQFGGGGGVASPLTEEVFEDRTYHSNTYLLSGDFLMAMEITPVKDIKMKDADNREIILSFAGPVEG